jgi:hypothetical protein
MAAAAAPSSDVIPLSVFEQVKLKLYSRDAAYIEEYSKLETVLDRYLHDIIADISREIDNISDFQRNSVVVAKKNPRLLSKYINKDGNINLIKCEINKLAQTNFSIILETVVNIINTVDAEKVETYIDLIFTLLTNKCYLEENNIANYIKFIFEIGKLEKYHGIITMFESYIESIFNICSGEINWQPGIKTEAGTNSKPEHFSAIGRIMAELLKMKMFSEKILQSIYNNMVLINVNMDLLQESRILVIIGFSQVAEIDKYIPLVNYQGIGVEMHKIIKSKLPYKFKYRLMDWYDVIKKKVNLDDDVVVEVASATPLDEPQSKPVDVPLVEKPITPVETEYIPQKVPLRTRIASVISRDINLLPDDSIISKVCKYFDKFAETEEISADISDVFSLLMDKLNDNYKNIGPICDFISIIAGKYDNIWKEDIENYFESLSHFNSININWQSNGVLIVNLLANKVISWNQVDRLIVANKKDVSKVVEIKLRIANGINSIGIKRLTQIIIGVHINKYLNNLNNLITRVYSINSGNPLLAASRDFAKQIEKQISTKTANRFDLLRGMMDGLE